MITFEKLQRKPSQFKTFVGLSVKQFSEILGALEPVYVEIRTKRLSHPKRKRGIGGGRKYHLSLEDRLLMTLMYFRLYISNTLLGYLFDLDGSNVGREINHRMLPALLSVLPVPMQDEYLSGHNQPSQIGGRKRIKTLKDLMAAHPEIKSVWVDGTEQVINRPREKSARKLYFSGKKQAHTMKTQVLSTKDLILHLSGNLPGKVNDNLILAGSGVMHAIPLDVEVKLDRGYEGAEERYPENRISKPKRAQRNHPLTLFEKLYNHILNSTRIYVEHIIGRAKKFRILSETYRNQRTRHQDFFLVVAGLLNYKTLERFDWA